MSCHCTTKPIYLPNKIPYIPLQCFKSQSSSVINLGDMQQITKKFNKITASLEIDYWLLLVLVIVL